MWYFYKYCTNDDIPQKEYCVYRFKVPINKKDGISQLNNYFKSTDPSIVYECRELSDIEYATGNFFHPDYKNSMKQPLRFKMREIPIYLQSQIRVIDLEKEGGTDRRKQTKRRTHRERERDREKAEPLAYNKILVEILILGF